MINHCSKNIQDDICHQFRLHINYLIAYHVKEQRLAEINRTEEEFCNKMLEYCEDLKWNNLGSTIAVEYSTEKASITSCF